MRNFIVGIAVGLAFGVMGTAAAAELVGNAGYLMYWEVTSDGKLICDDPYIWPASKEIACD
jgi:hypothetical protein